MMVAKKGFPKHLLIYANEPSSDKDLKRLVFDKLWREKKAQLKAKK